MVHGYGAAAGFFFLNFDSLAEHREVYAFDILGFGRSSRYEFSTKADVTEEEFVSSIEEWRSSVGLEKFVLMGTSFGGFLAASYAIKHPGRVTHLVLADPWGFPERTEQAAKELRKQDEALLFLLQMSFWMKIVCPLMSHFNLLAPSRVAGPLGPQLLRWARPDIRNKFADGFQDNTVIDYLYHCIAQPPSAETAFRHLQNGGWEWAKNPMLPRLYSLDPDVPITFIYGTDTWMDSKTGEQAAILRKGSSVDTIYIKNAGHHMYAEQHGDFNRELVRICKHADKKKNIICPCRQ
ncbi:PREDICTED: protein ABHD4-like [Branchiostoma belcheri]|uniref:Protein ABHD4-like n=1 Tax=Branchiostoma belcheri TaxID=7741 RepID=A0A6P5A7H5_BRABE|nr:PREDICTED: protein ABHD4-like [Branchiostoma belcheri]